MFSKRKTESKKDEGDKRFKLGECLGKGAFASVYRAVDRSNKKDCAVKKLILSQSNVSGMQPITECATTPHTPTLL